MTCRIAILGLMFLLSNVLPLPCSAQTTFTEVSLLAGVANAGNSHGVLLGDYDNDGDLDVYVINMRGIPNALYRNNGDGTFSDVAGAAGVADTLGGHGGSFGDYDNDGYVDLYVTNWDDEESPNVLFRNNGDGTFADVTSQAGELGNRLGNSHGALFGDYDNDGDLDLFVANSYGPAMLFQNNGDGTFTDFTVQGGMGAVRRIHGMASGDYDHDGDLDLYIGDFDHPNPLYCNAGDGTFTDVAPEAGVDVLEKTHAATFCDYDNDGDLDIVLVNDDDHEDFIYRSNGDGTFTKVSDEIGFISSGTGVGVAVGDYDSDGDVDLYVTNRGQLNRLFENLGDGTFRDVTSEAGVGHVGASRAAVFFDYDDDGDLDLYVTDKEGPNVLYRNEGNGNTWLKVRVQGVQSNRSGIGARVRVVSGDWVQIREVTGGGGAFQSSFELFFGLGERTKADSVIVKWPSGQVDIATSIEARQKIRFVEGFGPIAVKEEEKETQKR